jgi:hypothetical protein
MIGPGQARKEAGKALDVFLKMLPDPALRRAFAQDPLGYFRRHTVNVDDLPAPLLALFNHQIDVAELDALANASDHLQRADLVENKPNDPAGFATLCKF